jgi:hypothetical protein
VLERVREVSHGSSGDRPLIAQLQASRCVAASRRSGPAADSRTAKKALWRHLRLLPGKSLGGLLDHIVRDGEHARRHVDAECPRRLKVDDELEFGRLHDRQVGGRAGRTRVRRSQWTIVQIVPFKRDARIDVQ